MKKDSKIYLKKRVSLFASSTNTNHKGFITLGKFFHDVKKGKWMDAAILVRKNISDKERKKYFKGLSECITPSGEFRIRRDNALECGFTGVIVLDLDFKDNMTLNIVDVAKEAELIPHTLAVHKSISGHGYAIYVPVNRWAENTYRVVRTYYEIMLGIKLDRSTCNLSRLRYVSYDPDIYVADSVEVFEIPEPMQIKRSTYIPKKSDRLDSSYNQVKDLIDTVISNGDDPTEDYHEWFRMGCALANEFGEAGRGLFKTLSRNYAGYDPAEVDFKYTRILNAGNYRVGIGTLVYILQKFQ